MSSLIRRALPADDERLAEIDRLTWSAAITPQVRWHRDRRFFDHGVEPRDVLVAAVQGSVVGYVTLGPATRLASNAHVLEIQGLAVMPAYRRRGIARELLAAAIDEARTGGAQRLRLRVLATNDAARRLYESMGFETEGILREEFVIGGGYVDDVLMAVRL